MLLVSAAERIARGPAARQRGPLYPIVDGIGFSFKINDLCLIRLLWLLYHLGVLTCSPPS